MDIPWWRVAAPPLAGIEPPELRVARQRAQFAQSSHIRPEVAERRRARAENRVAGKHCLRGSSFDPAARRKPPRRRAAAERTLSHYISIFFRGRHRSPGPRVFVIVPVSPRTPARPPRLLLLEDEDARVVGVARRGADPQRRVRVDDDALAVLQRAVEAVAVVERTRGVEFHLGRHLADFGVGKKLADQRHAADVVGVAVGDEHLVDGAIELRERVPQRGRERGSALACVHGMSTSRPRRRRDSSPQNVHVAAAASPRHVSAECSRRGRGVAASRLRGMSTSRPRRRRDTSARSRRRHEARFPLGSPPVSTSARLGPVPTTYTLDPWRRIGPGFRANKRATRGLWTSKSSTGGRPGGGRSGANPRYGRKATHQRPKRAICLVAKTHASDAGSRETPRRTKAPSARQDDMGSADGGGDAAATRRRDNASPRRVSD